MVTLSLSIVSHHAKLPINSAGTGMKGQVQVGYRINFNYGSGPPENTCITGEVTYRHKGFEFCIFYYNIEISMATEILSTFSCDSFKSFNIVFEVGKYHSWPNTLPIWVAYWGAITRTPALDYCFALILKKNSAKTLQKNIFMNGALQGFLSVQCDWIMADCSVPLQC